jgi:hypothetical protein
VLTYKGSILTCTNWKMLSFQNNPYEFLLIISSSYYFTGRNVFEEFPHWCPSRRFPQELFWNEDVTWVLEQHWLWNVKWWVASLIRGGTTYSTRYIIVHAGTWHRIFSEIFFSFQLPGNVLGFKVQNLEKPVHHATVSSNNLGWSWRMSEIVSMFKKREFLSRREL